MQLLSKASKAARPRSPAPGAPAQRCAKAMLEGLPPVMWFIRRQMRRHRTAGLSVPQFRALCLLNRHPTAGVSLVAEHLGSTQPSASRLVTGLVSRGFVTRDESPSDRRQVRLELTARGRAVLDKARCETQDSLAEEIATLSADQQKTILAAMQILHDVFEHQPPLGFVPSNGNGNGSHSNGDSPVNQQDRI